MPTCVASAINGFRMRLIAYRVFEPTAIDPAPLLRPASPRRRWMEETTDRFAYRCLPLSIANQHGWEPFCPIFPIGSGLVEEVEPEIRPLESEPHLHRTYKEWSASRDAFNRDKKVAGSRANERGWQKFYHRGTTHTGQSAPRNHRTKL